MWINNTQLSERKSSLGKAFAHGRSGAHRTENKSKEKLRNAPEIELPVQGVDAGVQVGAPHVGPTYQLYPKTPPKCHNLPKNAPKCPTIPQNTSRYLEMPSNMRSKIIEVQVGAPNCPLNRKPYPERGIAQACSVELEMRKEQHEQSRLSFQTCCRSILTLIFCFKCFLFRS